MENDSTGSSAHPQRRLPDRIRRRTIVKGAAWSLPVIAAAAATPMAAASVNCMWTAVQRIAATDANTTNNSIARTFVPVPPGATEIQYTVVGAQGAAANAGRGQSAMITGTAPIGALAGQTLELIAGSEGVNRFGGVGFGNGGDGTIVWGGNDTSSEGGLGGGAGSAILVGGNPLIVAGGSGGMARGAYLGAVTPNFTITFDGPRGDAGLLNEAASEGQDADRHATTDPNSGLTSWALGGGPGTQSGPGAAGGHGGNGTGYNGAPGSGRDGGSGANPAGQSGSAISGAGGGGGGYFGGGGGGSQYWATTPVASNLGGGGGGGSSYADPSLAATSTRVSPPGGNGYVEVSFKVCTSG